MAWVNLGQAAHVVQAALDRRLEAAAGVSGAEYELLLRLGQEPRRPLQMTEIAGLLLSSRSGATRLVDRLVEAVQPYEAAQAPPELRALVRSYSGLAEAASLEWLLRERVTREQVQVLLVESFLSMVRDVLPAVQRAAPEQRDRRLTG